MGVTSSRLARRGFLVFLSLMSAVADASEPNAQRVSHFVGAAGESVPIQVPPFHGIEPRLSLAYSSEARNGFAGMGWNLTGVSVLERANGAYGYPMLTEADTYLLDGQPVRSCSPGSSYPSCATGGTHYTVQESYLRITRFSDTHWEVYGKDGTRTQFTPIYSEGAMLPLRLGQTKVIDTRGNEVTYNWTLNANGINGNSYLSSVVYNGFQVELYREARTDAITRAGLFDVGRAVERLKSIVVRRHAGSQVIRAYKLSYVTGSTTGKSLLGSVQMYGKDAVVNGAGTITGGTSLPAQAFTYQSDTAGSFTGDVQMSNAGPPPTQATEFVVWSYRTNTVAALEGNTLLAQQVGDAWDKSGYSSRALSSGNGYAQLTFTQGAARMFYFGQYGMYLSPNNTIMAWAQGSYITGEIAVAHGSVLSIQVVNGGVHWKVNGALVAAWGGTPSYPMVIFGSLYQEGDQIAQVVISGALVNYFDANCGGSPRFFGDFNGDGRQDSVCRTAISDIAVTLATPTGFANPTIWANWGSITGVGDFNNDGKDDLLSYSDAGHASVGLSDGVDFGAMNAWGYICGNTGDRGAIAKVADFTGDGYADLLCYLPTDPGRQFVAISQSTNFDTYVLSQSECPIYRSDSADANGDGREDLFCMSPDGNVRTLHSLTSTFYDPGYVLQGFCSANEFTFGDWNGDGATDAACASNGRVALRTGLTFVDLGVSSEYCVSGQPPSGKQRLAADLDGDGAAEWICNDLGVPANDIQVRRWNGLAFGPAETWRGGFCGGSVRAADFNGDGKKDLICESNGVVIYAGTKGVKADLLVTASNGIGGTSTNTWATSTAVAQSATGAPSTAGLPAKYVVASVTSTDGRTSSPTATTSFIYRAGAHDDQERKFVGFGTVIETLPALSGETELARVLRKFKTDKLLAGRPEEVSRWSVGSSAKLLSSTKYQYLVSEVTGLDARRTALLSTVEEERYDGTTGGCGSWPCVNARRTKVQYAHDVYGNTSIVVNHGDLDIQGDEITTQNYFTPNTGAYIVGLHAGANTFAGTIADGPMLTRNFNEYDGNSWQVPPVRGDNTKRWAYIVQQDKWVTSQATYDSYGNALSTTDPTGKTASVAYDATYRVFPVSTTNGASETTSTTWDYVCGAPATTTDPNGQTITNTYDALCRPIGMTGPLGAFETRSYIDIGNPNEQHVRVESPGPDGGTSWAESYFDGLGRTYQTLKRGPSVAKSISTEALFDARGNVSASTAPYYADETPVVTTFQYDSFNRPVKTTLPDGKMRQTSYPAMADGLFRVVSTNELGQSSTTKTNVLGQIRKQEKATTLYSNLITTRNYDLLGRMTSLVDPVGNTWSYSFDTLGRTLSKVDPDAGTWTYAYDDAGRVIMQQDAKVQTTTLEYDLAGRAQYKRIRPTGGATGPVSETVETVYGTSAAAFNKGRVTTLVRKNSFGTELNGKLAFEYDALGRVKKQTRTIDGASYAVERNYDTAGYLRGMKYPDNDIIGQFGFSGTELGYDAAGRLTSIPGILNNVTYNALGAPVVQTNANGTTTTKAYDAERFWLTDIDTIAPSLTLQNLHYSLNDAGMATAVDSDVTNEDWTHAYDELNRLTSSTNGVGANNQSWAYDAIGRFTLNSRVGSTFTYPSLGNPRPHAPSQISGGALGTLNFYYDANGNMQSGNGRTMTWNPENLITQVVANSKTTTFTYGPDGDRIKKAEGSTVTRYPFGDDYEVDGSSGQVTKYFNAGFGVIAKKVTLTGGFASYKYWLHTDRLGSVNATTDETGAQVLRRSFRSYGELLGQTGTHTESLGYIGQRTDGETANGSANDKGLTYLHARYYDSALGIFLSPDPAGADSNTYRYSLGDPVNFSDASGLDAMACWSTTTQGGGNGQPLEFGAEVRCTQIGTPNWLRNRSEQTEGLEDEFFKKHGEKLDAADQRRLWFRTRFGTGNDVVKPCGGKPCNGSGGNNGNNPEGPKVVTNAADPAGAQQQKDAVDQGVADALSRLDSSIACSAAFNFQGADTMRRTTYQFVGVGATAWTPPADAGLVGPRTRVYINSNGLFANPSPSGNYRFGDSLNVSMGPTQFRSTVLLHELGHQVGRFGEDINNAVNQANTQQVLNACFR